MTTRIGSNNPLIGIKWRQKMDGWMDIIIFIVIIVVVVPFLIHYLLILIRNKQIKNSYSNQELFFRTNFFFLFVLSN